MVSANSLCVLVLTYFAAGNFADYTTYTKFKQIRGLGGLRIWRKSKERVWVCES